MENKCPICSKKMQELWKPFCSKRCKDIDLGRWFLESYKIPSEETIDPYQEEEEKP